MNCHDSLLKVSKENTSILASSENVYINKFFVVYIYARIEELLSRWVQTQPTEKKTFDNVFIIFYLTLVLNLFSVILSFFLRKTIILTGSSSDRGSSWGPTFSKGGGVSNFFPGEVEVNADFYRNLLILRRGGSEPHIPAPLDPCMLTLDLSITRTYISDHAVYLNPRPVFTGMTKEFYQKNCFTSDFFLFCRLKGP